MGTTIVISLIVIAAIIIAVTWKENDGNDFP